MVIKEFLADPGFNGTMCEGAVVPKLSYNGMNPGPLVIGQM